MKGLPSWWQWAELQCSRLTLHEEADTADRELALLWRGSRIGQAVESVSGRLAAAWRDSATRAVAQWIRRG